MKTLVIDEAKAKKIYKTASDDLKADLETTFGKSVLSQNIMDRIKTMDDVYKELKIKPTPIYPYPHAESDSELHSINCYVNLTLIAKALNEGWKPDWTDDEQYKYYPWFDLSSGSGLVFLRFGYGFALSTVGSRLCFHSRELAEYAGKQFIEIYKGFMLL